MTEKQDMGTGGAQVRPSSGDQKLGKLLVEGGFISPKQLEDVLAAVRAENRSLQETLVARDLVSQETIASFLSLLTGYPIVDLGRVEIQPEALKRVPAEVARELRVVPVAIEKDSLRVVMEDPLDTNIIQTLSSTAGLSIKPQILLRGHVSSTLARLYAPPTPVSEPSAANVQEVKGEERSIEEQLIAELGLQGASKESKGSKESEKRAEEPTPTQPVSQGKADAKEEVEEEFARGLKGPRLLREVKLFEGLTDHELELVWGICTEETLPSGEMLSVQGKRGNNLYVILKGKAEITVKSPEGDVAIQRIGAGEAAPLPSLLEPPILVASIRTVSEIKALVIPRHRLLELCEVQPTLGLYLYRAASEMLVHSYRVALERLSKVLKKDVQRGNPD